MPLKANKIEFKERLGVLTTYKTQIITLPQANKELAIVLPIGLILSSKLIAEIMENVEFTIDHQDGPIDIPENFNVVQICTHHNCQGEIYLGLDEGQFVLQSEDIAAILATLTKN